MFDSDSSSSDSGFETPTHSNQRINTFDGATSALTVTPKAISTSTSTPVKSARAQSPSSLSSSLAQLSLTPTFDRNEDFQEEDEVQVLHRSEQYDTVHYNIEQYDTIQYNTVRYSTVNMITVQWMQCCTDRGTKVLNSFV